MSNLIVVPSYPVHDNDIAGIFYKEFFNHINSEIDSHLLCVEPQSLRNLKKPWFYYEYQQINNSKICILKYPNLFFFFTPLKEFVNALGIIILFCCLRLSRGDITHIHAHCLQSSGLGALSLKYWCRCKLTITEHSSFFVRKTKDKFTIYRLIANQADHHVAVSASLQASLINHKIYPNSSLIVPNFTNLVFEREWPQHVFREQVDDVRLVHVSRLDANKNFEFILNVLSQIQDYSIAMTCVGPINRIKYYRDVAERMELAHVSMKFIETADPKKICQIFDQSDIYLCASQYETFGITFSEAAKRGLKIVSTPCGGIDTFKDIPNVYVSDTHFLADYIHTLKAAFQTKGSEITSFSDKRLNFLRNAEIIRTYKRLYGK